MESSELFQGPFSFFGGGGFVFLTHLGHINTVSMSLIWQNAEK